MTNPPSQPLGSITPSLEGAPQSQSHTARNPLSPSTAPLLSDSVTPLETKGGLDAPTVL